MANDKPTDEQIASQAFEWATDYTPFEDDLPYHKYAEYGFEQGAKWAREQDKRVKVDVLADVLADVTGEVRDTPASGLGDPAC